MAVAGTAEGSHGSNTTSTFLIHQQHTQERLVCVGDGGGGGCAAAATGAWFMPTHLWLQYIFAQTSASVV